MIRCLAFALLALGVAPSLEARTILVDSTTRSITVDDIPFDFGGNLASIDTLPDGTMQVLLKGDLVLATDDTIRGVGKYPVVFLVGNDVRIPFGTKFDFSAIGPVPGAGGGRPTPGGPGGKGGEGGDGGGVVRGGLPGSGGLSITKPTFPPGVAVTTPGTPAIHGRPGSDGKQGGRGPQGKKGGDGRPGFGALASSGGRGGAASTTSTPSANPGSGGERGEATSWPPAPRLSNPDLRELLFGIRGQAAFDEHFYNGGDGMDGEPADDEPSTPIAGGRANYGKGAPHLAEPWVLSGGSAGGSGGGGAGGTGGPGGGGGGGGGGGQGEWAEPVPTSVIAVAGVIAGEIGSVLKKLVKEYIDQLRDKAEEGDKPKKTSVEIGDTGAWGGKGGKGGKGGQGGSGGSGGLGGAGGGAFKIVTQGRIIIDGQLRSAGGNGEGGSPGEGPSDGRDGTNGRSGGLRLPGMSLGSVFNFLTGQNDELGSGSGGSGATAQPAAAAATDCRAPAVVVAREEPSSSVAAESRAPATS